jgi:hypothetical protein
MEEEKGRSMRSHLKGKRRRKSSECNEVTPKNGIALATRYEEMDKSNDKSTHRRACLDCKEKRVT